MLSMTTDYATDVGCPEPYLRRIADAGFTHVHWCHHWSSDFLYSRAEIEQIRRWMDDLDLGTTDLHGSAGHEKNWGSALEYERLAGVELVRNRIEMTARLSSDVVVMHLPPRGDAGDSPEAYWSRVYRSLDELEPWARVHGVRIALENASSNESFDAIGNALSAYEPDFLGLCYDSGHGNMFAEGLARLDQLKDRLISIHLHDNDGTSDQHKPLFSGTTDWPRLAAILSESTYSKWISMELSMRNVDTVDEVRFLQGAYETGTRFAEMLKH